MTAKGSFSSVSLHILLPMYFVAFRSFRGISVFRKKLR